VRNFLAGVFVGLVLGKLLWELGEMEALRIDNGADVVGP
jgi:hypothetical protein